MTRASRYGQLAVPAPLLESCRPHCKTRHGLTLYGFIGKTWAERRMFSILMVRP